MKPRHWFKRLGYALFRIAARWAAVILCGMRTYGRTNIPAHGALLVCSNHQSHLDPVLVGLMFDRRLNYLARKSLFGFLPFRWLIEYLDAIPIDRDGVGLEGLKESLRRLRRGEAVLIFPEGTRTVDGEVAPLHPGFCVLARRGGAALVPVGLDGAFDAWPRTARLPKIARIQACIGEPIMPEEVERMDDATLVAEVERRIRVCHHQARLGRYRAAGRVPSAV